MILDFFSIFILKFGLYFFFFVDGLGYVLKIWIYEFLYVRYERFWIGGLYRIYFFGYIKKRFSLLLRFKYCKILIKNMFF